MGGILSYLFSWWSPSTLDTTPDPNTGLSERDRTLIRNSWALVSDRKTLKANGVEFFIQLFRQYPHMQQYFGALKDMNEEELRKSPKMRAHAAGVMYMLTSYVDNLDDAETLVALVQKLCESHIKRNIADKDFQDLAVMFVPYLKSLLGTQVTPEMEEAWSKLLAAQNAIMKATLEASKNKP